MAQEDTQTVDESAYLSMSDEEIMNSTAPFLEQKDSDDEKTETTDEVPASNEASADAVEDKEDEAADDASGEASAEEASEDSTKQEEKPAETKDVAEKKEEVPPKQPEAVNYEAEYKRLLAPFKANGRDIQVNSVEDAISLMQMGAHYNKKMAGLKPNLKMLKLLENNGLLSEEKISFLIELDKKNPEAVNKLVKDSGINPMDFDADKASEYKPKIHTVDEREIDLDTVLEEIQGTPTYTRMLEVVSKEWDGASKQAVASAPQLLKVINSHIANGIYDLISKEVESERMFGRLSGLSDIEAYRQVGDAIQARGGFNHIGTQAPKANTAPVVVTPTPKKVEDDKLKEKRRAASSTKPAVTSTVAKDFNPLSLSDDEFSKMADLKYR